MILKIIKNFYNIRFLDANKAYNKSIKQKELQLKKDKKEQLKAIKKEIKRIIKLGGYFINYKGTLYDETKEYLEGLHYNNIITYNGYYYNNHIEWEKNI